MSKTAQPALTVDSLVKFQYKKRFSFANRNLSLNEEKNGKSSEEEEASPVVVKSNQQHKGTAKLKKKKNSSSSSFSASFSSTSTSGSSSDDGSSRRKKKKKKKAAKNLKKKAAVVGSDDDEDDDEEEERRNKKLSKLFKMFPLASIEFIENIWIENNYNAKKCIDILLKEKENNQDDGACNKSANITIEEWSDGDEAIRARNLEMKNKRKSSNKLEEPPAKKKARVLVVSDDDEDVKVVDDRSNDAKSVSSIVSSVKFSSLNSSLNDSTDKESKKKEKNKTTKRIIASDDDDEASNLNKSESSVASQTKEKSSKKKKSKHKHKKKNKKNKSNALQSDNDDQDDDDFDRNDRGDNSTDSNDDEISLTEEEKEAILTLFNNSPMEDIQSMINISTNRLKTLLSLRPFQNYPDLHNRLKEKSLVNLIESAKEVIYARSIVNNLFTKCENISQKLEAQVAALIKSGENESSDVSSSSLEIKTQPTNLNEALSLKPYQLIGLNWLCLMHKEGLNGILADEMGLGKTCQTIAFLAHLLQNNSKQLHLIIVPPSTLDNWVRELSVWCPSFYFTVYQGSIEERRHMRFEILNNKFEQPLNAILTTYSLLFSTNEDKAFFRKLKLEYCVFDEAHMLKNMNSIRYQSLIKINSKRKLLLTGTPMQNNLVELMSLLYFVMPDMFHHKTEYLIRIFKSKPSNVDVDSFYSEKISQAKGIMKPFILRRVKSEVLKQLPKKVEEIIYCDMAQRQAKDYNSLIEYYKKRKDQLLLQIEEKNKQDKQAKNSKNSKKHKR